MEGHPLRAAEHHRVPRHRPRRQPDGQTQTVTPAAGGSRLELDIDYDLPGGVLGDVVDRLYVERRNEREADHTLQNLKDYLEDRSGD